MQKKESEKVDSITQRSFAIEKLKEFTQQKKRLFDLVIGIAVFLNVLLLGVEIDVDLGITGEVLENLFCALWVVEVIIRTRTQGISEYLKDVMNRLDLFLAAATVVDVWILQQTDVMAGLKCVAVLRALRLVRLIRLVKAMKAFQELWLLVHGLIKAVALLFWVFVLFALMIYVGAIFVTILVGGSCNQYEDHEDFKEVCSELFGNLLRSMMTLWRLVTFDGFAEIVSPVIEVQPWMIIFFVGFTLLCSFGIVNIVMGVIVDQTLEHSRNDVEKQAKLKMLQQQKDLMVLKEVFAAADKDGDGHVSLEEFLDLCTQETVQQMFSELNLPVNRPRLAKRVFEVMDADMNGQLEIDEFLIGTTRLKEEGQGLEKDKTLLLVEIRNLARQNTRLMRQMAHLLEERGSLPNTLKVHDCGKVKVTDAIQANRTMSGGPVPSQNVEGCILEPLIVKELKSRMMSLENQVEKQAQSQSQALNTLGQEVCCMRTQMQSQLDVVIQFIQKVDSERLREQA